MTEETKSADIIGDPGSATMRGTLRDSRSCGYTTGSAVAELLDDGMENAGQKGGCLHLSLKKKQDWENKIGEIRIADNIPGGFKNLDKTGPENPMNSRHDNPDRHDSDDRCGEWGMGMKSSAQALGDTLEIITKIKTKDGSWRHLRLVCDWVEMSELNQTKGKETLLTEEKYKKLHKYEQGTTLIIKSTRGQLFPCTFNEDGKRIMRMVKNKFYHAINECKKKRGKIGYEFLEADDKVIETGEIKPEIPPTEQGLDGHPHDIHIYRIEYRKTSDGSEEKYPFYYAGKWKEGRFEPENKPKWMECINGNVNDFKKTELSKMKDEYKTVVDTVTWASTRVSGTPWGMETNDSKRSLPKGGLIIQRNGRVLTEDWMQGGQKTNALEKISGNGEQNYVIHHLKFNAKSLGKNFGANRMKTINCNFIRGAGEGRPFVIACRAVGVLANKKVGRESKFKSDWKAEHPTSFDPAKTFIQNNEAAAMAAASAEQQQKKQQEADTATAIATATANANANAGVKKKKKRQKRAEEASGGAGGAAQPATPPPQQLKGSGGSQSQISGNEKNQKDKASKDDSRASNKQWWSEWDRTEWDLSEIQGALDELDTIQGGVHNVLLSQVQKELKEQIEYSTNQAKSNTGTVTQDTAPSNLAG